MAELEANKFDANVDTDFGAYPDYSDFDANSVRPKEIESVSWIELIISLVIVWIILITIVILIALIAMRNKTHAILFSIVFLVIFVILSWYITGQYIDATDMNTWTFSNTLMYLLWSAPAGLIVLALLVMFCRTGDNYTSVRSYWLDRAET